MAPFASARACLSFAAACETRQEIEGASEVASHLEARQRLFACVQIERCVRASKACRQTIRALCHTAGLKIRNREHVAERQKCRREKRKRIWWKCSTSRRYQMQPLPGAALGLKPTFETEYRRAETKVDCNKETLLTLEAMAWMRARHASTVRAKGMKKLWAKRAPRALLAASMAERSWGNETRPSEWGLQESRVVE